MNKSSKLLLLTVTVFLLASSASVECRRTYSSRSSSSGRGNRGKNQPSSGGIFSSWFGGSKSASSGSGSVSKPAPASPKKNWQTATSHATAQSKSNSNWANPYYKPPGSAPLPSAPKQPSYGWKPAAGGSAQPIGSHTGSNVGSRGYPVQSGVQQGSQGAFGGYKPASGVPNAHASGFQPSGHQTGYGGYHGSSNYHPPQTPHGYQPSHGVPHQPSYQPSYHPSYQPSAAHYPQHAGGFSSYHPSYSGHAPHGSFGGAVPSYQGTKLFGGTSGHYGYPGSGGWGIDTYGGRKSSGTGKLLTGLAVGAAGGYLTSSLVNSISNPWKYSGYGYGSRYGYGPGYDFVRSRDESAFERGYERGIQARQNENNNNNNNNNNNRETSAPEDPTSKWIQCVAFDPQTQQTLINPNCSCTVTTSLDERTGQPISVHHCTTLNGLVMKPVPVQSVAGGGANFPPPPPPPPSSVNGQAFEGATGQPVGGVDAPGSVPSYGYAYQGNFEYNGGPTVYLPPRTETKTEQVERKEGNGREADKAATETGTEQSSTAAKPEGGAAETESESPRGSATEREATAADEVTKAESALRESKSETPPAAPGALAGGQQESARRTADFYGRLQKIVSMGNFVDGG